MDWSQAEVGAAVSSYFGMLKKELTGQPFNKALENRLLLPHLNSRNRSAVEFKHQNISAVLLELGWLYIVGYKPRHNIQKALQYEVEKWLQLDQEIEGLMQLAAVRHRTNDFGSSQPIVPSDPPEFTIGEAKWAPRIVGLKRDYAYQDARNRSLGSAGERAVVNYEKARLLAVGMSDLAHRVEHVAQTQGDGLGYDVLSFTKDGGERRLEVKTTLFSDQTPFFISKNEVLSSAYFADTYSLVRIFNFSKNPAFYELKGDLRTTCSLEPINYRAGPSTVA